jgi:hypothetical protein
MHDNQNGQKIMALTPADMARLTSLIIWKTNCIVNNLHSQSADGNTIVRLPCLHTSAFR